MSFREGVPFPGEGYAKRNRITLLQLRRERFAFFSPRWTQELHSIAAPQFPGKGTPSRGYL